MIDERIRIQENYDMTMETAIDEAREEGLEQGLEQGLERGRHEGQLEMIRKMLSKGLSLEVVSDVTGLSVEECSHTDHNRYQPLDHNSSEV